MVTKDSKDVPYHMRDDSDDEANPPPEYEDPQGESQSGHGDRDAKEKKEKSGLKGLFGRKTKVGTVKVDPGIDYADWSGAGPGLDSRAKVAEDGTINIWVDLKKALPDLPKDYARPVKEWATDPERSADCPLLNIVIFIVGSRGDVQPYLSLALHLIKSHGHRVRIATHPDFKDFILEANKHLKGKTARGIKLDGRIEYYDIGGNVRELMAYMVKNPGIIPGWETIKSGDIQKKRNMTAEMLQGFYNSCIEPDPQTGKAFAADAIISNPPAFAHVHIAEGMGLPLLMSFTMPWSPTTAFKHPLVNIKATNAEKGLTNYFSFGLAELLTWQGLGDVINHFRANTLGLAPLVSRHGAGVLERLKVPWTYCWSQGLIEKPDDWKENIDISGFYFYEGDVDFQPPSDLADFLAAGDAPIYIGFGSVVVEDPAGMTKTIFEATKKAGVRALVSAGWGGLGDTDVPDNVFILKGSIPHDWLFAENRVTAVCHHGGAGTTAIGLKNGLPTIVVPFFGDQQFWGDMIHRQKAGPAPIPHRTMTVDNLSQALKEVVSPAVKTAAGRMGEQIRRESGEQKGVDSFHRHLPLKNMLCEVEDNQIAMWWSDKHCLRLSGAAAAVLEGEKKVVMEKLRPLRAREYATRAKARDPISGGSVAVLSMVTKYHKGVAEIFYNPPKGILNTMFAIPQGMLDLIVALHEGFDALPAMMGSQVRERGRVDDFGSGVTEAGKGLFYGWWDGITGLVTEPIAGGKKEGALGVIKGMGRSSVLTFLDVNVTARPAAGVLGVMALPIHGAFKSIRRQTAGQPERALAKARREVSQDLAKDISPERRQEIISRFAELDKETAKRKEQMKKRAKLFLLGDEQAFEVEEAKLEGQVKAAEEKAEGQAKEAQTQAEAGGDAHEPKVGAADSQSEQQPSEEQVKMSEMAQQVAQGAEKEMAVNPDLAKQLEEAERKGYERALAEQQKRAQ